MLGDERIRQRSTSGRASRLSESETWRPLATVDELRRLPSDEAVLVHASTRPARLRLRPYYRQRAWRHLTDRWQTTTRTRSADAR